MCDYTRIAADEFVSIFIYFCVNFINLVLNMCNFPLTHDVCFIHESMVKRGAPLVVHTLRSVLVRMPLKIMQQKSRRCLLVGLHVCEQKQYIIPFIMSVISSLMRLLLCFAWQRRPQLD